MRKIFLGLVFFMLLRTISGQFTTPSQKKVCTRADMDACTVKKEIYQDRAAMLAKDMQRTDVYMRRDDHDGSHCDDCCLYSKVGDPQTQEGRKMAYCMDVGDCDLCVDSCNTTCTCELPDKDCWEWEDCAGKAIEVGTACKAVCSKNKNYTETFTCEDASGGQPPIWSTISSISNTGLKTDCDAVWMYKGNRVTVPQIVDIGIEMCSGTCDPMVVEGPYNVTCQNWNNETGLWVNVTVDEVTSEGACKIKCFPSIETTQTVWTYYCYPDNQTATSTVESECQVFWHGNDSKIRTIEQINQEINTDDCNGTTIAPGITTTTLPPLPPSTTPPTPEPPTTTTTPPTDPPPPNCIGDCQWPPFTDPRGTWDNSSCLLTCELPPGGMIGNQTVRIPPLNATCTNPTASGANTEQFSYSTGEGTNLVELPFKYTENDPYCPRPCKRPPTCPPSILKGKPNPCKYICSMPVSGAGPQPGPEIQTETKCQLQCFNENVMSGPTVTTTSPVNRRKRQATLPGDITTPIIETAVSGNGITTPKTGEISTPVLDTTAGGITPDSTPGGITPDSTPGGITPDSTPGGITATNEIENPMAVVTCNNDTTLIGADGKPYEYNEQDPQWEELCDNTTVMVFSKMVYSENDIGGDFPLFDAQDAQQPAKPAWENLWCTNVMLDQWSRVSPKGLATGYDKEKDPETTSLFVRRPNLPDRNNPKPYDNATRRMPDDDQFYHLLEPDTYENTSDVGEVEVGGFPPLNLALQAHSEFTWKDEGLLNGKSKTHGYYEGIYQRQGKDQINHYFTDNFYLTVGEGELDPLMKRKLVRKVNIWVPIFDDSCFDYCGEDDDAIMKCRKKCKPLNKAALDALGVTVTIKCTSCDTDPDELVKFYYNSTQTQLNVWHDNLKMYPHGNDSSITWVGSQEEGQPMYTAVGPPGLWEVQCSVDPAKGPDYITTQGNPDAKPQKRWLRENTLIPCSLNLKLDRNEKSAVKWNGFLKAELDTKHKELMKFSLDWSVPNKRVSGEIGLSYILYSGTGKGLCGAKAPKRDATTDVPWACSGTRKEAKTPLKPQSVGTDTETDQAWHCAVTHTRTDFFTMNFTKTNRNHTGIGYALNTRCCSHDKSREMQCEKPGPENEGREGNNMGVGPTTLVFTDKIFTDVDVPEDEELENVKNILIVVQNKKLALLQSQVAVSVQYKDATGKEKLDRINIERGVLHGKQISGSSLVMMCLQVNNKGQVTKMERPYNKWLSFGGDSGHLNELQAVDPNNPPGTDMAMKVKCGNCFDLFCNWKTIEVQDGGDPRLVEAAKYRCCECAKEITGAIEDEGFNKDSGDLKIDASFNRSAEFRCPWKGTLRNYHPNDEFKNKQKCTCQTEPNQGASRSIKAQGPKDEREFEPQVLRLGNDDGNDDGVPDQAEEGLEEEEGGEAGGNASSKEYFEEADDVSYLGANQELLDEAEDTPL